MVIWLSGDERGDRVYTCFLRLPTRNGRGDALVCAMTFDPTQQTPPQSTRQPTRQSFHDARQIFEQALAGSCVEAAFARQVHGSGSRLAMGSAVYDLSEHPEICVIALGKAAAAMFDALAARLPPGVGASAIVVAPQAPRSDGVPYTFFRGGHPEPNADSVAAAQAILARLATLPPEALVLFLLSGGASSMCELPIDRTISLADMIGLHRLLVGCGAAIAEVNSVRKHLSRVKGGRLAVAAGPRRQVTLLISDVPAGAEDALGSGPSLPDTTTLAGCRAVLNRYELWPRLPHSIRAYLDGTPEETPKPGDASFERGSTHLLADNDALLAQAAQAARALGYEVVVDTACDDWDYARAAAYLLERLRGLAVQGRKLCLLSGGEVTVRLPAAAGLGGRNQQFALHSAARGLPPGVSVFSAGSDGVDGNSPAAGAIADSSTRSRAAAVGWDLDEQLCACNAYPLFAALGDCVETGPTGNNLRDLRILLYDGSRL